MEIEIKILYHGGKTPSQNTMGDAGYDLYSAESIIIPPGERETIDTGIALSIPYNYVGLIWPRSGLSVKNGIDVLAGVIDCTYRGEIKVCLLNTGGQDVVINKGDKIAQILFQKVEYCNFKLVDELDKTTRGENRFGSSG